MLANGEYETVLANREATLANWGHGVVFANRKVTLANRETMLAIMEAMFANKEIYCILWVYL